MEVTQMINDTAYLFPMFLDLHTLKTSENHRFPDVSFFLGGGEGVGLGGDMEREIYNCIADGTTFVKPSVTIKFPSSLTKLSWEWGLTAVVHLKSCFPCHSSSLQIIVETSRVVFQISSSIHCLIPIRLGCLVSYISM